MKRYKISDMVISRLVNPKTGKATKVDLEILFDCSQQSINNWVRYNEVDGPLTREAALRVIEYNLGLSRTEILSEVLITL